MVKDASDILEYARLEADQGAQKGGQQLESKSIAKAALINLDTTIHLLEPGKSKQQNGKFRCHEMAFRNLRKQDQSFTLPGMRASTGAIKPAQPIAGKDL